MNTPEIIRKKRDGKELTTEELRYLIEGYSKGEIPDYQLSAWAMAVYYQGMTARETADLTMAMVESGDQVDLSAIPGVKVDKHSTGGVGDTTTLVLAPLVAAVGVPVAKMSGRGLGHTGGTIDKLESIPGFSTEIPNKKFLELVQKSGIAVMGQTANLTPADKQLYGLRDVTGTVESIPLIASSIMSKKIAAGSDAIVLDVKTGDGAFMKEEADAVRLAEAMVAIGHQVGRKTVAIISDMSQPLGYAIGNAMEIREAIDTLRGEGPEDLTDLCTALGTEMLLLAGKYETRQEATQALQQVIENGAALEKMEEFVSGQGGDIATITDPGKLPQPKEKVVIHSDKAGYIQRIHAEEIGLCAMRLGAGRATKADQIDFAVGVELHRKVGDAVEVGTPLATLYVNSEKNLPEVEKRLIAAMEIGEQSVQAPMLIRGIVTPEGFHQYK
ncbi:pyrimidine-nucleoside phosphorylase [Risungbinella massiliensis]|uniref:pyrimidine-nucleoside phosphorylase n=1 Tax=Risungbinella massiliensis TaxID=1329796 RepID=UPI0005CBCA47|nr:pyrimidine-nucleoside phosphorylase [Risungbinella massiliensis]